MARVLMVSSGVVISLGTLFYILYAGLIRRGYDLSIGQLAIEFGGVLLVVAVLLGGIALIIYGLEKRN